MTTEPQPTRQPERQSPQQPERTRTGIAAGVGVALVALTIALSLVAWWLVVPPPPPRAASSPSTLEHGLFDQAQGGDTIRAAGARALEDYRWIDRSARIARIPIDRAIDAVAADPSLIAPRPDAALAGAP